MTAESSRLEWLEVRGFRSFGSSPRRMDLSSNLVVIHAGNSQGKTSLAEAVEFLVSGRSSRRDLFGGAKAEYSASLRNAHLPGDDPVWVAAGIRDDKGSVREVRRDLVADFSTVGDCESRLTVDGVEVPSLAALGIDTSEGAISAPVLLQHTLRYVLSTEPKQRATYFKALLALTDLDLLRERVRAQVNDLNNPDHGPGIAALDRLARTQLSATATDIQRLEGSRIELAEGIERVLLATGVTVLDRTIESTDTLEKALKEETQVRKDRVFPLSDLRSPSIQALPELPDVREYIAEIQRTDEISATLLPVFDAVLHIPEIDDLDHATECPVCLTPEGLTPARIAQIQGDLRNTKALSEAAEAAKKVVNTFRARLQSWSATTKGGIPAAATWNDSRAREVAATAEGLGEEIPNLLDHALTSAGETAVHAQEAIAVADQLDIDAAKIVELIDRRTAIPEDKTLTLEPLRVKLAALENHVLNDSSAMSLTEAVEPLLRTRLHSEGTQELLEVLRSRHEIVQELHVARKRVDAQKRLEKADRVLKKATGVVLDQRFATMSDSIMRWWESIRPEELVGFAGVKRRAAGAVFVNLVAAMQADAQGEPVQRDALGVFSDSQLNALGLSTFLARTELVKSPFVFLDDPIPGSDGDHRLTFCQNTLANLLSSGMQVIVTTYDPKLAEHAQTINESWEPITYDLTLLNIVEGTEPAQTSDLFSNYMLQGEDGINAPTSAGRRGASTAYRSAAERLAKQVVATNRTASGTVTSVADIEREAKELGKLIPLVVPYTLSPDEKGKWQVIPKVLNPGNHDDGAPSTIDLKQIRGNLRQIAKAHSEKWGKDLVR